MTYLLAFLAGIGCLLAYQRWSGHAGRVADKASERLYSSAPIAAIRWEQTGIDLSDGPIRHLRRHRPTHDMVTNVPFLQIVRPKGNAAGAVSRRCAGWTLPIVMLDRRSGRLDRVVLLGDDPDLAEKHGILRRTSIRTMVVKPDASEEDVATALAA